MIPLKPQSSTTLSPNEQHCLAWYVLSGCKREEAFRIFLHPEMGVTPTTLEKFSSQFFASKPVMDFIENYKNTIEKVLEHKPKVEKVMSAEDRKKKKEEAVQKLTDFVVGQALDIENVDDKEDIIKFADKLGLLGDGDEIIEAPRRYLPITCSDCAYRKFVEENCENVSEGE